MNARKHYKEVIIQEFFKGEDFRIMVVGHKVVAVMKRIPAHIFGDGISTIKDLIARENDNIIRGKEHDAILTHITIDSDVEMYLQSQ
jgi:cyanophycin synthetase